MKVVTLIFDEFSLRVTFRLSIFIIKFVQEKVVLLWIIQPKFLTDQKIKH